MTFLRIAPPESEIRVDVAIRAAYAALNCEPLGGASPDGWSRLAELQRCAYSYYLRYEKHLVPRGGKESKALAVGSLFHACLALYYCRLLPEGYPGHRKNPPPPLDFLEKVRELGADSSAVADVERLYGAYSEYYGLDETLTPVAVEYSAGVPGVHTCRYDMLAWYQGALWVVEHKSVADLRSSIIDGWWLDGEIVGQHYAWRLSKLEELFGARPIGTIMNLATKGRKPELKRLEVVLPQKVIDRFACDRASWNVNRERCQRSGCWSKSLANCVSKYGMCQYWEHCRDEDNSVLVEALPF